MSKQKKQITLESLAATMEAGFKRMDSGFKSVREEMAAGFEKAEENRENLAVMISNGFDRTAKDISGLKDSMVTLEHGQEDLKLRLDSLAPHFEVKQLERRVKRLEDRAGIRHSIQH